MEKKQNSESVVVGVVKDPPKIYLLPSIGVTLGDGLSNPRKLSM